MRRGLFFVARHLPGAHNPRFDHSAHRHDLLLRHVPPRSTRALDVGCGKGAFARKLASRVGHVDALDRSPEMIRFARDQSRGHRSIAFIEGDVMTAPLAAEGYDFVSLIASLHHLPEPGAALERLRAALRPGGVLAILAITARESTADLLRAVVPTAVDVGVELALTAARRPVLHRPDEPPMPVLEPTMTASDLHQLVARALPGARVRQLFFFRTLVVYTKQS